MKQIENLSTLSKLDFPRSRHKQKEGTLENILHKEEIKRSSTNGRTKKVTTDVANDTKTRSELFASYLERLGSTTKAFQFILAQCRSKVITNKSVNIIYKVLTVLAC